MKCLIKNCECEHAGTMITMDCPEWGEHEGFHTHGICYNKEINKDSSKCDKKPRIYISGPISGHDINERRAEFQRVSYEMICRGYEPVNPMENGLPPEATTREHMKRDIELIMTCDCIYMMRRWTHSKGCKVEFDVATSIGLPVFFEESGELIEFE